MKQMKLTLNGQVTQYLDPWEAITKWSQPLQPVLYSMGEMKPNVLFKLVSKPFFSTYLKGVLGINAWQQS